MRKQRGTKRVNTKGNSKGKRKEDGKGKEGEKGKRQAEMKMGNEKGKRIR